MAQQSFTTPGTGSWKPPPFTETVTVECWAGGGASGPGQVPRQQGNGGGGGAYVVNAFAVDPKVTYSLSVGARGVTNFGDGGDSWFSSSADVLAKGGHGSTQ